MANNLEGISYVSSAEMTMQLTHATVLGNMALKLAGGEDGWG